MLFRSSLNRQQLALEVQRVFGDDLFSFAAGRTGFGQIGQEITDYEDLRQAYHDVGMDVGQATRETLGSILSEHGSVANYQRWLRGGQIAKSFSEQFSQFNALGFETPTASELQEQFRTQGEAAFNTDIQRKLREFTTRRGYLNQIASGGGAQEALGANPNLGRVDV